MRGYVLLAGGLAALGLTASFPAEGAYVVSDVKNPEYRPNTIFSGPEDLTSPRFKGLVELYELAEAVRGEKDEFRRILLLRNWLNRHVKIDKNRPAVKGDALGMLADSAKGGSYSCGHFMTMQNAVLNAMGHVTRCIFAAAGEKEQRLSGAHGINEVWVNSLAKWVMLDAELDSHFEKDGVPLSALEIRDEVQRDGAKSVFRHKGPDRKQLPRERDDTWGHTPRTYAWVAWYPEANVHTVWPKKRSSREYVYDDEYWRTHKWYRGGKLHWAYKSGYFDPVKDRGAIYWTPNVLSVKADVRGSTARVRIESITPNLEEYQIRAEGGEWAETDASFNLKLTEPRHEWRLRSVNLMGVTGPEYRLVIESQ